MKLGLDNAELEKVELIVFDFDGVFTDNMVYINQDGMESVRCWRGDGLGISRVRSFGIEVAIISSEINQVVSSRSKKLSIQCWQGVEDKASAILAVCRGFEADIKRTIYVGNDINDIPALKLAGIPIAVGDAHPEIMPYVLYRTKAFGGCGAVREVCDLVSMKKTSDAWCA